MVRPRLVTYGGLCGVVLSASACGGVISPGVACGGPRRPADCLQRPLPGPAADPWRVVVPSRGGGDVGSSVLCDPVG